MTPIRLLTIAILLCPLAVVGQDQHTQRSSSAVVSQPNAAEKLTEPWRIIPPRLNLNDPSNMALFDLGRQAETRLNQFQIIPQAASDIASLDDSVCYKIRSYVVARDSKNSDSVHPVKYTTCVPASRYRLKTTEMREIETAKTSK